MNMQRFAVRATWSMTSGMRRGFAMSHAAREPLITVSDPADRVRLLTLNRPKALNALCSPLFDEFNAALDAAEADESVGAVVVTGSEKAFAAGADIKEMKDKEYAEIYKENFLNHWGRINSFRKPTVAAVSGFALGGGSELAMMCDVILAAPNAVFGQPEINLGVIPGAGGTQRLTHAIGKSRAMEVVLTGTTYTAQQAADWGLVSRVVENGPVVDEAVAVAKRIASKGLLASIAGKEAVNASFELPLGAGLSIERRLFQALFATADQKLGMNSFANKEKVTKWNNA